MNKILFFLGLVSHMVYASTLELSENKSPTGKDVYRGEYGVCILATGDVADESFKIREKFGINTPTIIPHITLMQGNFDDEALSALRAKLTVFVEKQAPFSINMATHVSKGGGGNTFWDVERSLSTWEKLNAINDKLCQMVSHPVGLMQQVKGSLEDGTGDREKIEKWGRDFNIPGSNRPHITVVYGVQDEAVVTEINNNFPQKSFLASKIHLVKIDCAGNVVDVLEAYEFVGTK